MPRSSAIPRLHRFAIGLLLLTWSLLPSVAALAAVSATPADCMRALKLPEPRAVVVDFERRAILFAVDPNQHSSWPSAAAPSVSTALSAKPKNSFESSALHNQSQARLAGPDARWVDVTPGFQPLAGRLFDRIGPKLVVLPALNNQTGCPFDHTNCHGTTNTLHFDEPTSDFREQWIKDKNLREIHPSERSRADIGLISSVRSESGALTAIVHSFSILKHTDWAIHKLGWHELRFGADPIDEAIARYSSRKSLTIVRYFVLPENYRADMAPPPNWTEQVEAVAAKSRQILLDLMPWRNRHRPPQRLWFDPFVPIPEIEEHYPMGTESRLIVKLTDYHNEILEFRWGRKHLKMWLENNFGSGYDKDKPLFQVVAIESVKQGQDLFAGFQKTELLYRLLEERYFYSDFDPRIPLPQGNGPWPAEGMSGQIVSKNGQLLLKITFQNYFSYERLLLLLIWNHALGMAP